MIKVPKAQPEGFHETSPAEENGRMKSVIEATESVRSEQERMKTKPRQFKIPADEEKKREKQWTILTQGPCPKEGEKEAYPSPGRGEKERDIQTARGGEKAGQREDDQGNQCLHALLFLKIGKGKKALSKNSPNYPAEERKKRQR